MFVTPKYNRWIPSVLKNAFDNASRPYGQSAWKGKPADYGVTRPRGNEHGPAYAQRSGVPADGDAHSTQSVH